ncbi:MAG TPA: DNA adenine methylase [Alphaproteobacteria bacterium]|jgi:DNA adenine methylase
MSRYRTPLRYPGGKQRLTPFVIEILQANGLLGADYVEPYAGGAGVAMELLLAKKVSRVHLNDSSAPIYAFWKSIKSKPEAFCRRISRAALNVEEWRKQREVVRNPQAHCQLDLGFATFYLNRCNRSGVLNGGLIGGLDQKGQWKIDARFPRKELIQRVENIAAMRDKIRLKNMDAEDFIQDYVSVLPTETFVYCDPPYFEKANRLYLDHYAPDDHKRISKVIQKISQKWIVSYDGVEEILDYYHKRKMFLYSLQYNAARAYKGTEVFVFSDRVKIPPHSLLPEIDVALRANAKKLKRSKVNGPSKSKKAVNTVRSNSKAGPLVKGRSRLSA